tara:strand:- start:188 stop:298 length:111 start_codon:yes stop_codon:yes gene_type:complete
MEDDHNGMSEGQGVGIVVAIIGVSVFLIGLIGIFLL